MKVLLSFLFSLFVVGALGQTTALSFTTISGDVPASNRGAEYWGTTNWDDVYAPKQPAGNTVAKTQYIRLNWRDIENNGTRNGSGVPQDGAKGEYHFNLELDVAINHAIDMGATFKIAIMPMCTACGDFGTYPGYVHTEMQALGGNNTDWFYSAGGFWVPNWNCQPWIDDYNAVLRAVANHIATTSHSGKTYASAFIGYDRRDYGDFGEGHNYPWNGSIPTGRQITDATFIRGVDSMTTIFPNVILTQPMNYVAPDNDYNNSDGNPGTHAAWYALTKTNNMGPIGVRRDNLGDDGYNGWLTGTTATYNPGTGAVSLHDLIMNQWKYSPFTGEPARDDGGVSRCGTLYCDLHNEDTLFHISSMGNGNYQTNTSSHSGEVTNLRNAWTEMGFRLVLTGGTMTTTLLTGSMFNVTVNWQNTGLAPVYEKWNVVYQLRTTGGTTVASWTSSFTPRLFLPSGASTAESDNFTMPVIAAGTYNLYMIINDPAGYKLPLQLAITGRGADGSYPIRTGITVSTSAPAVADAGTDQSITLPTSSTTLNGSGSTGTITSYAWTQISGPNTSTISTPSLVSTTVSGLVQGTYLFQLSVNGGASTDLVQVVVNPAIAANAGADQSIILPVSSVSLSGSASVGATSYSWTNISGPNTPTIVSATSVNTNVTGLIQGVYIIQLSVNGGVSTDQVQITVNAAGTPRRQFIKRTKYYKN